MDLEGEGDVSPTSPAKSAANRIGFVTTLNFAGHIAREIIRHNSSQE